MPSGEIVIRLVEGGEGKGGTKLKEDNDAKNLKSFFDNPALFISKQLADKNQPLGGAKAFAIAQIGTQIVNTSKQAFNFYMQNVGKLTGDISAVHTVQQIQAAMGLFTDAGSIGLAMLTGAPLGPAGIAIAGTAATIGVGIKYTEQAVQYYNTLAEDNRSVIYNKQVAGGVRNDWSR